MLWHYARGVPKQTVALEEPPGPIFAINCLPPLSPDPGLKLYAERWGAITSNYGALRTDVDSNAKTTRRHHGPGFHAGPVWKSWWATEIDGRDDPRAAADG